LPAPYLELALGTLEKFFPEDFDIDLNGRTLPWEAAILIPFADEELFLEQEKRLFDRGMQLTPDDWKRNTTSFSYPAYHFDHDQHKSKDFTTRSILQSPLKRMNDIKHDCSKMMMHDDYTKVGQFGFASAQLPGVVYPQNDFPSLKWLNVIDIKYSEKFINKVRFE